MNNHPESPEACIDRVLNALRDTEPPTGLEARITARIVHVAEVRPVTTSYFAVILNVVKDLRILRAEATPYTLAATALPLLLALSLFGLRLHHKPLLITQSKPLPNQPYAPTQPATLSQAPSLGDTRVLQGFSLGSHIANQRAGALAPAPSQRPTDPDAIALAETLAPSRPAPLMPLTPQERILFSATRQGEPIEITELELARAPILRAAAEAHEKAGLQQFARSLVSQLVTAESLDPAPDSDAHDSPQTTPTPNAPSSSPNQ
jgi:hypothetical protein